MASFFIKNFQVNVNIVPYGNELYALTETNLICKIDPKNLEILKTINVSSYIPTATTTIAHPHVEPDGSWIICGMNTKEKQKCYEFIRYRGGEEALKSVNICEQGEVIARIPSSHDFALSYFHSFGLTPNYIIFLEQSLKFSLKDYLAGLVMNKAFVDALIMDPTFNTRIHIINKKTGEIVKQKFHTDPLFVFHHINAFEKYDSNNNLSEIVVDVCAYNPKHFEVKAFSFEESFTDSFLEQEKVKAIGRRISIPMGSGSEGYCPIKDLNSSVAFELPTINYSKFNGLPYKYFYGINFYKLPFSIVKIDVENPSKPIEKIYAQDGYKFLPSEPVFVENPNATSEDDGVLVVMVLSNKNDYLSILDAKTLEEIARADLPSDVQGAMTFHGEFNSVYFNF